MRFVQRTWLEIVALQILLLLKSVEASILIEGTIEIYYRLTKEEIFRMDLLQYSSEVRDLSSAIKPVTDYSSSIPPKLAEAYEKANKSLWYHQDYFVYSISDNDCWEGKKFSPYMDTKSSYMPYGSVGLDLFNAKSSLNTWPYNLTTHQVISRSLQIVGDTIYVSSSYFQVLDDLIKPTGFVNLVETRSIKYNETSMSEVKDVLLNKENRWKSPSARGQQWTAPALICPLSYYVVEYEEAINICLSIKDNNETDLIVQRPKIQFSETISTLPASYQWLLLDKFFRTSAFKLLVEASTEGPYEMIIYHFDKPDLWMFQFDRGSIFKVQAIRLGFNILQIDYAMRTIMIFYRLVIGRNFAKTISDSYYLFRSPGQEFKVQNMRFLAMGRYLKTLQSSENIEIIVEMVNFPNFNAEPRLTIEHSLYKFDLMQGGPAVFMESFLISTLLVEKYRAMPRFPISFSMPKMPLLQVSFYFFELSESNSPKPQAVLVKPDLFIDRGGSMNVNGTYYIFPRLSEYDPYTGDYFFVIEDNFELRVDKVKKNCRFLRQRVVRPYIQVGYNNITELIHNSALKYLGLPANYSSDGSFIAIELYNENLITSIYRWNFTFLTTVDVATNYGSIWTGSNMSTYFVASSKEAEEIDLRLLVRGNFIMRVNPNVTLNPVAAFPYYSASFDELEQLADLSFFKIDNYRMKNNPDPYLENIESLQAFARTTKNVFKDNILLVKRKESLATQVFELSDRSMRFVGELKLEESIKKVILISENKYLLFDSLHELSLFDVAEVSVTPLRIPGTKCSDLAWLYHTKIRPAFICLNNNFDFVVYFSDSLLKRSLSISMLSLRLTKKDKSSTYVPKLDHSSKLIVSDVSPGKVFVYHANSQKNEAVLSIYYVAPEQSKIYFITSFTYSDLRGQEKNGASKIQSLEFVEDRLVVHYKDINFMNFIGVYILDRGNKIVKLKFFQVPIIYQILDDASLTLFHCSLQSVLRSNTNKPYLVLPFTVNKESNALLIDPFSPLLETIPTFLLPKESDRSPGEFQMFRYYASKVEKNRLYSVGFFHRLKNTKFTERYSHNFYHLFQLVKADSPKVHFSIHKEGSLSYDDLFRRYQHKRFATDITFLFTNHYSRYHAENVQVSKTLTFRFGSSHESSVANLTDQTVEVTPIGLRDSLVELDGKEYCKKVELLKIKYTEIPKVKDNSIFDWKIEPESLFDNIYRSFEFKKPMELDKILSWKDVSGILNVDTFCRAYKINNGELICSKIGWIFFEKTKLIILNEDNLEKFSDNNTLKVDLDLETCTEFGIANHSLFAVCAVDNVRTLISVSLLDLSQTEMQISHLPIFPKISSIEMVKTFREVFIQYRNVMENNEGYHDNLGYVSIMHSLELNLEGSQTLLNSPISPIFKPFSKFVTKSSGNCLTVGKIARHTIPNDPRNRTIELYRAAQVIFFELNSIMIQFGEAHADYLSVIPGDFYGELNNDHRRWTLEANASDSLRKIIFDRATAASIVINKSDPVAQKYKSNDHEETYFQNFVLINLPNYHAFLYRYFSTPDPQYGSFFKLENPFAEIENRHWDNKPVCFKWACILVSTFDDDKSFLRVYDLRYEELSRRGIGANNWEFAKKTSIRNSVLDELKYSVDISAFPANYTIRPIQVLNVTGLQLVRFDETHENNETLTVLLFVRPSDVRIYHLNRQVRLTTESLYFTSKYVDLAATTAFGTAMTFRYRFDHVVYQEYYFNLVYVGLILAFGAVAVIKLQKVWRNDNIQLNPLDPESEMEEYQRTLWTSEGREFEEKPFNEELVVVENPV